MSGIPYRLNEDGSIDAEEFLASRDEKVEELRSREKAQQHTLKEYKREHGKLEVFFSEVMETIREGDFVYPPPKMVFPKKLNAKVHSPCSVVLCANDWHYGAFQDKDEIEGFGSFSIKELEERIDTYVDKVIDWVDLHRSNYHVDHCSILCLGDLISGDIHEELRVTNEVPSPVQTVGAGNLLANMVYRLAPHFKNVSVEFVVADNHSRLTKKPQAKEEGRNSFNYVVGHVAKILLEKQKNVEFNIHERHETVVEVSGRRYLLLHGHGIMGWMGFPYYGVERRIAKEALRRMNAPDMRKFHRVIMGHWHSPLSHPWYWISGSAQGTDAYDHQQGRYAQPSQAAWMVHPKWGEFDRTDFYLT